MSEVHRYSVVKMLSEAGNKISYDPHGPEVVMAKDYDDLAAKLAMAEDASKERDRLRAENEALRGALQAVQAEVDGNLRPLTRDLVNMVSGLNNGSHPNDIYDHCDEIERTIGAALEGAKP